MLSPTMTAAELAAARVINRAVPAARLDEETDAIVSRLLDRSAFALAWTKRVLNRSVAAQLNLTLDSSIAYEQLNFAQIRQLGVDNDPTSLASPEE